MSVCPSVTIHHTICHLYKFYYYSWFPDFSDYGAKYEKTETLEEMITAKKSPWNLDYRYYEI